MNVLPDLSLASNGGPTYGRGPRVAPFDRNEFGNLADFQPPMEAAIGT